MVLALGRVYKYVKERGVGYKFTRKEVKHLFRNENDTARFGDWVMFGGLVFKDSKAHYGLNMERCEGFFNGTYPIPTLIIKNPVLGELERCDPKFIHQIPNLTKFLNDEGFYIGHKV
jgi:hypothetical protein